MAFMTDYGKTDAVLSTEHYVERISLEANVFADIKDTFTKLITNVKTTFGTLEANIENILSNIVKINPNAKLMVRTIKDNIRYIDYFDIQGVIITVPDGFSGNYLEYIKTLNALQENIYRDAISTITDYKVLISAFITNVNDQKTLKDLSHFYKQIEDTTEKNRKLIAKYFEAGKESRTKIKLGRVIPRAHDLIDIVAEADKLQADHNRVKLVNIDNAVMELSQLIDIVIKKINNNEFTDVSPIAAKNIGLGAYHVAKMVEFVAVYYTQCIQMLVSFNDLSVLINNRIKDI